MESKIVIVAYKAKAGKKQMLEELMRKHYAVLKKADLVTERQSIIMHANDDVIIEVFEWKDEAAIKSSHNHPEVLKMWGEYNEACEYVPLNTLQEANDLFAAFNPFE